MSRSQVSIQINWVFVLIAGFLILLFFIGIVYRQRFVSQTRLALGIAADVELLLTGAGVAAGTVNLLDKPDIDLNVGCDVEPWFGVDWLATGVKKDLPRQIVFGPDFIRGNKLLTWALSFDAPFKVSNVLFLTSPDVRYIFVNPQSDFALQLFQDFPDEAFKEVVPDSSSVLDKGSYKVRLVFFDVNDVSFPSALAGQDVSAVSIVGDKVEFFENQDDSFVSQGDSVFLSDSLAFGAIFAEDLPVYDCSLKLAFDHLSIVSDIYALREGSLDEYFSSIDDTRHCADYYNDYSKSFISDIRSHANSCRQDFSVCKDVVGLARNRIGEVETRNEVLKRVPCPLLY